MSTFISVGNATQPFPRLLDEVARLATTLPQPVLVQHGATPFQSDACRPLPFVNMSEFEQLMGDAELLILHAGAGSVIHAVRLGKVPVVMPRRAIYGEHVDDHQVEFAKALAAAGRVVVADDTTPLCNAVQQALELQREAHTVTCADINLLSMIDEILSQYSVNHVDK